jgi:type IV pilus assembly protein PilB
MSAAAQEAPRHRARPIGRSRASHSAAPLGEQLVRAGIVTAGDVQAALDQIASKNMKLGEVLLQSGLVDEDTLLQFLAQQMGVPAVRLRDGVVDPKVVRLLPRPVAEAMQAIALFRVRDTLSIAMADPLHLEQLDELERITGLRIRPVLTLQSSIATYLPRCYEQDFAVDAVTADLEPGAVEVQSDAEVIDLRHSELLSEGSPVVNLVNYVMVLALRQHASDIHIEPGHQYTTVRFRVDGQLREALRPRREFHPAIVSRVKVMAKLDIAEHRLPQDGRIHVAVDGRKIDLRISTLPTILGEKVVMRVLDRKNITFKLDYLGMPQHLLADFRTMLSRPHGLVLVTGPTGSGKTTTLYSAVELIKSVNRNIITVEDPVEYQLELINQVQVGGATALSFADALRSILRQDPDIIMVGEIRDAETATVAIQAALTGHLVLSTLHTNDSGGAITRLLDMGVPAYKISAALLGVVAQRLVRLVCSKCRRPYFPPAEYLEMIHYRGDVRQAFNRGEGCPQCFDTGFQGRQGIYEVLRVTPEMRRVITSSPELDALRQCHRQQGGTFLLEEGIRLAEQGATSLEEVVRVAFVE